jgi:hypothetical protein
MEAIHSNETSVTVYQSPRRDITEDLNLETALEIVDMS